MTRTRAALGCGSVIASGPIVNFVLDATDEYPFYDHGLGFAVFIAAVLTTLLGLVFLPPIVRVVGSVDARSVRGNLLALGVLTASVWLAHLAAWWTSSFGIVGERPVWMLAYPVASAGALAAIVARDRATAGAPGVESRSPSSPHPETTKSGP